MPRGEFDRTARRLQTRGRLLAAAATVYAREGFTGATLDDVAAEAGFTKGAVYDHFGSKENLLVALWEEHVAAEMAEQIALFDLGRSGWERPLAGSEHWMERMRENPDPFRLFVELWVYAQRDERLRERLAAGLDATRSTFARFSEAGAHEAGIEDPGRVPENMANVMMALGVGLPMMAMIDPVAVDGSLLGATLAVLVRSLELDPEAGAMLNDPSAAARLLSRRAGQPPT